MNPPRGPVTLLTDFGTRDGWVGVMKGSVASLAPSVPLHDVAHDLPQGDIAGAARALGRYWDRFPPGTVHLVVVDPGVGTERRPAALEAAGRFLVAPDNGVGTPMLAAPGSRAVILENPAFLGAGRSATFHGRDIFAPAAGHLARGVPLDELGPPLAGPVRLEPPLPSGGPGGARGTVVSVDRFGNLATNLPGEWAPPGMRIRVGSRWIPRGTTYGDVERGALLAVVNSDGMLEVAVRDGSATQVLGVGEGAPVEVVSGG